MAKKDSMHQQRQVVIIGEGLGILNRLVAASTSHEELSEGDHVAGSFLQADTHTVSSKPPPPRSAKDIMSVQLHPSSSLGFRRPLTTLVKRSLTITNNNSQPVAFKVKTTAPKLYCVRPNSGRVDPGESIDVSVMLQALKEEPPMSMKCKDKFLIQSTIITPDKETLPLADIWASPDTNEEGKVFQQKLRVTYLPAEGQVPEEDEENQAGMMSMLSDNDQLYDTVRQPRAANGHPGIDSQLLAGIPADFHEERAPTPGHDAIEHQESQDSHVTAVQIPIVVEPTPAAEPNLRPSTPALAPTAAAAEQVAERADKTTTSPEPLHTEKALVPIPEPIIITRENPFNEELFAKYNQALTEVEGMQVLIATLQQQLKQAQEAAAGSPPVQELRRRTRRVSDADSAAPSEAMTMVEDVVPIQQEGVPLNVVVVISLLVFITTYLFF